MEKQQLNDSINIFYLNNSDVLKKYNINFEIIKPGEKDTSYKIFIDI